MIKMCMCVKRLPDISREEFPDYWQNHHAQLVAGLREGLGIARYAQAVLLPDRVLQQGLAHSRGAQPYPFDGLGEVGGTVWSKCSSLAARLPPKPPAGGCTQTNAALRTTPSHICGWRRKT